MLNPQQQHYERIHDAYAAHYYDATSLEYRRRFILDVLFEGADLSGQHVVDLASGSGFNSLLVRDRWPTVRLEGLDISNSACADYVRYTGNPAHRIDLTAECIGLDTRFDAACMIGGLHHCTNDLSAALRNVARLVRPGGEFFFYEPNAAYFLQRVRDIWYKRDDLFDETSERALDHDELVSQAAGLFAPMRLKYLGGPAYFVILNSLVLRVPLSTKRWLAKPLFGCEWIWNAANLPAALCPMMAAVWKRTSQAD